MRNMRKAGIALRSSGLALAALSFFVLGIFGGACEQKQFYSLSEEDLSWIPYKEEGRLLQFVYEDDSLLWIAPQTLLYLDNDKKNENVREAADCVLERGPIRTSPDDPGRYSPLDYMGARIRVEGAEQRNRGSRLEYRLPV